MIYDFILLLRNPFLRRQTLITWAGWVFATLAGWFAAGLTSLPIGRVVVVEGGMSAIISVAGSMGMIGALIGALTSTGQWLFLRRRYNGGLWWILAGAVGWGLGLPFALVTNLLLGLGISAGLYGLFVGGAVAVVQWAFSRSLVTEFRRWLLAALVAYVFGISAAGWLERTLLIASRGVWGAQPWQSGLTAALAGGVVGAVTGIALVLMLFNQNNREEN